MRHFNSSEGDGFSNVGEYSNLRAKYPVYASVEERIYVDIKRTVTEIHERKYPNERPIYLTAAIGFQTTRLEWSPEASGGIYSDFLPLYQAVYEMLTQELAPDDWYEVRSVVLICKAMMFYLSEEFIQNEIPGSARRKAQEEAKKKSKKKGKKKD